MATFRPTLWATLGTLALGAVFLAAGAWQLRRAAEKEALFSAFSAAAAAAPLSGSLPDEAVRSVRYRRIALRGRYDPEHQILLDARVVDQRSGYEVLTPFHAGGDAVLVNRGWIAAPADRSMLPEVPVDGAERAIVGQIDLLPRAALRTGSDEVPGDGAWPRRLLFPTAAEIGVLTGYPVHDYQVLLDPAEKDGYMRQWRPKLMGPEQHLGYAVQWFALAAVLGIIYVALHLKSTPTGHRP
jgi:surfeit locus 1 family protein